MGEQVDARFCGGVAQLGEHLPCKQGVDSSNLFISTNRCAEGSHEWEGAAVRLRNRISEGLRAEERAGREVARPSSAGHGLIAQVVRAHA